jgi:hypothetical protein
LFYKLFQRNTFLQSVVGDRMGGYRATIPFRFSSNFDRKGQELFFVGRLMGWQADHFF